MGLHLAELCLAAYGGHFWTVGHAIEGLASKQGAARVYVYLPNLRLNFDKCLYTNPTSRPLLAAMAMYGFAPVMIPVDSTAAELISKNNIGGIINNNAIRIGISEAKWEETECEFALIPSSQSARLRIAKALIAAEITKSD